MNSNELNRAMLCAHLSGNEIKVILAYISKGGWKPGQEVFLPESVIEEYGLANSTVKRMRKSLIEKGWLVPTGNKSRYGCDKYLVTIPADGGSSNRPTSETTLNPQVGQIEPSGGSFWSTEVIKSNEVSNQGSNQVEQPETSSVRETTQEIPPESSSGLNEMNTGRSASGVFKAPAGGPSRRPPGRPPVTSEDKARSALAAFTEPGTYKELNEDEQTRAVAAIRNPHWNPMIKDVHGRAKMALDEQTNSRETTW
ncbi:MAG: hypothetical protein ACXVXT_05200 [Blastococcus sp.]